MVFERSDFQSGTSGITKTGGGTTILNGSAVNTYAGTTTVNAGTLVEDFSNVGSTAQFDQQQFGLALGGGTLQIKGNSSAGSSQTFGSTALNAGASTISAAPVSVPNYPTVALRALTTTAGSTLGDQWPGLQHRRRDCVRTNRRISNSDPSTGLACGHRHNHHHHWHANSPQSTTSGNSDYWPYATVGLYDFAAVSGSSPFTIVGYSQISGGHGQRRRILFRVNCV